jgi:hypothetical protein
MDRAAEIRSMRMLNDPRWAALAEAGDPPTGRDYPHASDCRAKTRALVWDFDIDAARWRRGPCGGSLACSIVETFEAHPPAPPRPTLEQASEFEADHGRLHVELSLELAAGDRYPSWRARCSSCGQTRWFRTEAASHYMSHGAKISDRPPVSATLGVDVARLPEPDPDQVKAEEAGAELGRVVGTRAALRAIDRNR